MCNNMKSLLVLALYVLYANTPSVTSPIAADIFSMQQIIDNLKMMNPEDLLPEDQYLLGVEPEDLATARATPADAARR